MQNLWSSFCCFVLFFLYFELQLITIDTIAVLKLKIKKCQKHFTWINTAGAVKIKHYVVVAVNSQALQLLPTFLLPSKNSNGNQSGRLDHHHYQRHMPSTSKTLNRSEAIRGSQELGQGSDRGAARRSRKNKAVHSLLQKNKDTNSAACCAARVETLVNIQ